MGSTRNGEDGGGGTLTMQVDYFVKVYSTTGKTFDYNFIYIHIFFL